MNTPLSWVKVYVPELECSAQEYADAMTLSGSKVENYVLLDKNLDKIIVGKIIKIEKHPDADKLIVCQVQVSEEGEMIQIVTGASNIKEGDKVPVVLDGGRVAASVHDTKAAEDGIKIKKGKLRGVESFGMMCSIEELGCSREMYLDAPEDGIYILSDNKEYANAAVGSDAIALLGLRDAVFEYEITSNRVDCFSVIGLAREAAATFRKKFVLPELLQTGNQEKTSDYISVEIKDEDLCPRYTARVVKNIKIKPSPEWMQRRLAACGIRPINNIVDITNYVMEEYGQPMHAYDLEKIAGKKIIVRRANEGEEFQTLDGQIRKLNSSILMICDAEKPIGIAGIMGGENSKITNDVTTMLFEAACFNGTNIRISGKKLGMRTDAQAKFEKGLDPNNAIEAINRACQLIEELDAGEIVGGCVDVYSKKKQPKRILFNADKINQLLGTQIEEEVMLSYLQKIDLVYDKNTKEIIVPTFRQDLECIADLAEEVARFYGYDKIPTTLPNGETTIGRLSFKLQIEAIARNVAQHFGFSEEMTYSFESPKVYDKLLLPKEDSLRKAIVIANPLGEDYSVMRNLPLNGILTSLSTNYNHRNKNVRLYELANIYLPKSLPLEDLPEEKMQFTLGMYGEGDFFYLKGVIEEFLEKIGLTQRISYNSKAEKSYLHPGRQANIIYDNIVIGYLGEVHPEVLDNYEIGTRAYLAVLDMQSLLAKATFAIKYDGVAKYPAITRDISMVVPDKIMAGQIEDIIWKSGTKLLESCSLFDIYEGTQIKEGYKSMAYSICFRAKDRTLEDKDVQEIVDKILNNLRKLGIELRQ